MSVLDRLAGERFPAQLEDVPLGRGQRLVGLVVHQLDRRPTHARQPRGELLLGVVAAGLVAYGVYQLANPRYRRMRVT